MSKLTHFRFPIVFIIISATINISTTKYVPVSCPTSVTQVKTKSTRDW